MGELCYKAFMLRHIHHPKTLPDALTQSDQGCEEMNYMVEQKYKEK